MFHTSSYGLLRWIVLDSTVSVDESMDTSLDESMDKSMGISGFRVYLKVLDYVGFIMLDYVAPECIYIFCNYKSPGDN